MAIDVTKSSESIRAWENYINRQSSTHTSWQMRVLLVVHIEQASAWLMLRPSATHVL